MQKYSNDKIQEKVIEVNGNKLTKKYIQSLSKEERIDLIEPTFEYFRKVGFIYPDNLDEVFSEFQRLLESNPDIKSNEIYNNSSVGTYICKYFCNSFFQATEYDKNGNKKLHMIDLFDNDDILKKLIYNRFGLGWFEEVNEAFNISPKMMIQGFRSMRLVNMTSMFKPDIAKYMCLKYSNHGELVYDYSAGFGGRMLGAASCGRRYLGVDPLTHYELTNMIEYLGLKNCEVLNECSEYFEGDENSIDLCYSSPPYYMQEVYSVDDRQAYNKGKEYFYDIYWDKTLDNIRYMLKPGRIFGLNVKDQPIMVDMAKERFKLIDEIRLKTVRSHLNKKNISAVKYEPIYIFVKED
jgi:hypothetical protein